ncbi:aldolase catalytic domain-containing protein [Pseudomonas sp. Q1-7]|uniref:aldolase catalytic domain-containing protein n=1 Tax=Pseudomonas sp. Q1-7 TaxID=3020843 RepID=UPI002301D922|nr:aldolase catalytic domain-containing protein [Pseudomonas sp. Q1-7]
MNPDRKRLTILDCTLRDGGYYNNWDYPTGLVRRYLEVMQRAEIDYVELGLRAEVADSFAGPYAFTVDEWIRYVGVPEGLQVGVMCNAKDLLKGGPDSVSRLFSRADDSPVKLVRIAAHFSEIELCSEVVQALSSLGYKVGFNFMQSNGRSAEELRAKARLLSGWPVEVLYFADSMGNMSSKDVAYIVAALREGWSGELGFHAHDNMGFALSNCMTAIELGVTWIDATVLGMGRGAGNARIETLLLSLAESSGHEADLSSLLNLVVEEFQPLQKEYGWGPNLYYHLSAMYGVHPTYVQEMLSDGRYKPSTIITALRRLGESGATGFSHDRLLDATQEQKDSVLGSWSPKGWLEGRDVLMIGPGAGVKQHLEGLLHYINTKKPYVLCINSNDWFPVESVNAWVACNRQRLLLDRDFYAKNRGTLVVPVGLIDEEELSVWKDWNILDYGMVIQQGHFEVGEFNAILPAALSAIYGLGVCSVAGANRVLLAGFDGYDLGDPRHSQMEMALTAYRSCQESLPLVAITPSSLSLPETSPYAPQI